MEKCIIVTTLSNNLDISYYEINGSKEIIDWINGNTKDIN